ncbi:MAG: DUF2284 domain-containing protein [Mogibacterium sp.]|nr:DUF2284 domain-containing protein [Mogibacterium sp.]
MILETGSHPNTETLVTLALEAGFTQAAPLNMDALLFRSEVRDMCAADRCKHYDKSWSCPPAIGSLEQITAQAARYHRGILVQTTAPTDGDFDMKGFYDGMVLHQRSFDTLTRQVRRMFPDCLPMAAGSCMRCRKCTYPDRPCRFPDRLYPSMEAYGLLVSDVCIRSGLKYNYGPRTITYTACILLD